MRALFAAALCLTLAGCVVAPPDYPYNKEPDPRTGEYVVGVSDELRITVWKNGDLNTQTVVRPDGTITIPLIGDVTAAGATPTKLKDAITQKLSAFIKEQDAVVTVAVTEVNSYFVTVAGNVTTPGRFNSQAYLTVQDAVALAGGPNRFADADETIILRSNPDGTARRIPVNYDQITQGLFLQQNLVLLSGDTVFVP